MKAIVFDLDGTLIHSAPDLHAAAERMLRDFGRPAPSLEQVISFIGNGVPALVARCLRAADAEDIGHDEALACFRRHYLAESVRLTQPYAGVVPMLRALRGDGYRLGVCTNKSDHMTARVLDGLGLADFFETVVGGDSLPVRKPAPEPLELAFERLGASSVGALYVGDSEVDAETAAAADSDFALFSGGYRKTPVEDLRTHFVFDDFARLTDYVRARAR